jgi:hypothetical protein
MVPGEGGSTSYHESIRLIKSGTYHEFMRGIGTRRTEEEKVELLKQSRHKSHDKQIRLRTRCY